MKRFLATAVLLFPLAAQAHDFWLEPADFHIEPESLAGVEFIVGHGDGRREWPLMPARVVSFESTSEGGVRDQQPSLRFHDGHGDAAPMFIDAGTQGLSFESAPSYNELPAEKFNDYIQAEGLAEVIDYRRLNREEMSPGRETYSRRAKSLIQVGDALSDIVTAPLGQTLELVPLKNPYALEKNESLQLQVLYQGEPLPGATVSLENLRIVLIGAAKKTTGPAGVVEFSFPKKGAWKANVVWSVPIDDDERADFQTIFSSLTFGYDDN